MRLMRRPNENARRGLLQTKNLAAAEPGGASSTKKAPRPKPRGGVWTEVDRGDQGGERPVIALSIVWRVSFISSRTEDTRSSIRRSRRWMTSPVT